MNNAAPSLSIPMLGWPGFAVFSERVHVDADTRRRWVIAAESRVFDV